MKLGNTSATYFRVRRNWLHRDEKTGSALISRTAARRNLAGRNPFTSSAIDEAGPVAGPLSVGSGDSPQAGNLNRTFGSAATGPPQSRLSWRRSCWKNTGLILDSRVLTEEPGGATIVSDSRSCLPSKGFGCCDGRHRPSAGTDSMASPQMINLTSLIDDAKCYELIRHHRWPDGVRCTACSSAAVIRHGHDETQ